MDSQWHYMYHLWHPGYLTRNADSVKWLAMDTMTLYVTYITSWVHHVTLTRLRNILWAHNDTTCTSYDNLGTSKIMLIRLNDMPWTWLHHTSRWLAYITSFGRKTTPYVPYMQAWVHNTSRWHVYITSWSPTMIQYVPHMTSWVHHKGHWLDHTPGNGLTKTICTLHDIWGT